MKQYTAAERRFFQNATLIGAQRVLFAKLAEIGVPVFTLGELAETASGGTPDRKNSSYFGGPIRWMKSGELTDGLVTEVQETVTEAGLANSNAKVFPVGTLLIALYGATVGKTGILRVEAATNQAVCAVVPRSAEVRVRYLFWFLRRKREDFLQASFGGAQPNISQRILRDTLVPLPSPEIQDAIADFLEAVERRMRDPTIPLPQLPTSLADERRIVVRIEELASEINEARALRQKAVTEADVLSHSCTEAVFRKLLDKVGTKTLGDICRTITDGDHNTPQFSDEGVRFIFVGNVSSGRLHFENCKRVSRDYFMTLKSHRLPERGDILYSAVGATLGIPALVHTDEPFCFQRHVAILKPDRKQVDSQFIWHMLGSRTVFEKAWASTTGSAQPTIPLHAIRELPIPVPLLDEQRRIVAELDALQAEVDTLKSLQTETAAELDALLPAILDRAFKGEL